MRNGGSVEVVVEAGVGRDRGVERADVDDRAAAGGAHRRAEDLSVALNVPARLTSSTRRKSSTATSSIAQSAPASGGWSMPALLTRIVGAPSRRERDRARAVDDVGDGRARRRPRPATSTPITSAPAAASAAIQIGPSRPRAPVTTATWPGERRGPGQLASAPAPAATASASTSNVSAASSHERPRGRRPRTRLELVGRQAVAGRLHRDVVVVEHVAGRQVARGDELLGHLQRRRGLALVDLLRRRRRARRACAARSRTILRRPCGSSEKAWSVPFIARLSVKCFSTIRAAEDVGRDRHRDPVVVAGEARRPRPGTARGRSR